MAWVWAFIGTTTCVSQRFQYNKIYYILVDFLNSGQQKDTVFIYPASPKITFFFDIPKLKNKIFMCFYLGFEFKAISSWFMVLDFQRIHISAFAPSFWNVFSLPFHSYVRSWCVSASPKTVSSSCILNRSAPWFFNFHPIVFLKKSISKLFTAAYSVGCGNALSFVTSVQMQHNEAHLIYDWLCKI